MFNCPVCDKRYTKQTSLNRHSQNHQKGKGFTCQTCHVSFFRRDLLSRHVKMHRPNLSSSNASSTPAHDHLQSRSQPQSRGHSGGNQQRQRCHTACNSCRDARTRCDGRQPCTSCVRSDAACEYSRTVRRVSQAPRRQPSPDWSHSPAPDQASSSSESGTEPSARDCVPISEDTQVPTGMDNSHVQNPGEGCDVDPSGIPPNSASSQAPTAFDGEFSTLNDAANLPQFDFMDIEAGVGTMDSLMGDEIFDTTSWPTLHENLFLQPDCTQATWWPGLDMNQTQSNGLWHGNETIQDETARALMLMSNGQQKISDMEGDQVSATGSTFVNGRNFWHSQGQNAQRNHGVRSGTDTEDRSGTFTMNQTQVIDDIVSQAALIDWVSLNKEKRSGYWRTNSAAICNAFALDNKQISESSHCLQSFLDMYIEHFHPLWPLLSRQNHDADSLCPILYLTLVSIGAMYGGVQAAHVGTLLHARLRRTLTAGLEFSEFDHELIWLCQSRLLTQVAALYFGRSRAFSYAQHLGGILVAQARRMNLFTTPRGNEPSSGPQPSSSERLSRWLALEERRRLAFGILRAETYTSVLLNTRPLVSPEEIDLELPYADSTWRGPRLPPDIFLAIVEQDRASKPRRRFSDIIRIALERHEQNILLDASGHELLLFGLQQSVWRFSHDPGIFERLTGNIDVTTRLGHDGLDNVPDATQSSNYAIFPTARTLTTAQLAVDTTEDHLGASPMVMADLQADLDRLMSALQKGKQSLNLVKNTIHLPQDRNCVLSSMLLHHLSYIRLRAPLENMHYISYRIVDKRSIERLMLEDVRQWANSRSAIVAALHACLIWQLISRELQRAKVARANFNFLAFASLHHAAVVLWTFMGASKEIAKSPQKGLVIEPLEPSEPILAVERENSQAIIALFSKILDLASAGRWSSFGAAALRLSTCQFPTS